MNVTGSTGNVTYNWNNGLPSTIGQQNISPGTYVVTVTDALGCFAIDTVTVDTLLIPQVAFTADSVCIGLETSFFDNSTMTAGATYAWDFDNDNIIDDNTVGNTMYEYSNAGNFEAVLAITSVDGCINSDTVDVFVEDLTVSFTGLATEYCANDEPIELIGNPVGGTFSGIGVTGNFFNPSATSVGTNTISYTYSNALGCTETVHQNTQILSLPSLNAGEDIDALMTLCEADITTKNPKKFKRYHQNFEVVRTKIKEVEERDKVRNFQPPITGEEIMKAFNLKPCREIGQIKEAIKEAILDGAIPNEHEASYNFMLKKGVSLGLKHT